MAITFKKQSGVAKRKAKNEWLHAISDINVSNLSYSWEKAGIRIGNMAYIFFRGQENQELHYV